MSNIRLFNEDAMSILSKIKDNSIDLVCIDPPYKTTSRGCSGTSGGMFKEDINKKGRVFKFNDIDIKEWLPELYRVLKPMGHCYIMTNNKNIYEYLDTIHTLDCNGGGLSLH